MIMMVLVMLVPAMLRIRSIPRAVLVAEQVPVVMVMVATVLVEENSPRNGRG